VAGARGLLIREPVFNGPRTQPGPQPASYLEEDSARAAAARGARELGVLAARLRPLVAADALDG
jgi:hypothetical protein